MKDSDFKQLSIVYKEHNMVWCYCCFHKDTIRPNLSISLLDTYYGRYKCWACSAEGYLTKEQMSELKLSDSASFTVYKNDRKNLNTRWAMFNQSCYDNLQKFPLLKLGLAKQLNVSTKSLDEWQIGYDGNSFTVPMFRENLLEYLREGGMCGVQRRYPDGTKRCVTGSHLGLMYPQHLIGDYYIFICEGLSDAISVWDLGLQCIARPHCRYIDGVEEFFGDGERGIESIIIIPDNDTVGLEGAKKLQGVLNVYCWSDDFEDEFSCECSIFSFDGAKDIRSYIAKVGKQQAKKELERCI